MTNDDITPMETNEIIIPSARQFITIYDRQLSR